MVDRNSRTPAGIEDVTAIEGRQVVRITGGLVEINEEGANHYGDMYSDDAVIADTDNMAGTTTGGAAARSTRTSHRGPDSTTPGTNNNTTSGGVDGGGRRMNTASQNNRVWNTFEALCDDDEEDEREGAGEEYGTRGNTSPTNGTGTNNNTGRGGGGEGNGGGHAIAAPRSNRSTTISTSGGTTDPPAANTPRNNLVVPTQFATNVPPTPAADPAATGLVASSSSSSDRTTSGGPRGTEKDGTLRNNNTTVVVADKKTPQSSDGSIDTQGEKSNALLAVILQCQDFRAHRFLRNVAATVFGPSASEQIGNEAMTTIWNLMLHASHRLVDRKFDQYVQQFLDSARGDMRDMINDRNPTADQVATALQFFPELLPTVEVYRARPHNLMDLPDALLARPLGYLDTQSIMIVSTLNKQYRAAVRGSEEGLFRPRIYISAMKADAKKQLTEAEDAAAVQIAQRDRRINQLTALLDNERERRIDELAALLDNVVRLSSSNNNT